MYNENELWQRVLNALQHHKKNHEEDASVTLNRLAQEWADREHFTWIPVMPDTVHLNLEQWTISDIQNTQLYTYHSRDNYHETNSPLIVLGLREKHYVIDGNNRINYLRKSSGLPGKEAKNLEVIIVKYKTTPSVIAAR